MYFCKYCKEAVEPAWEWETVQGDEQIRTAICPLCGEPLIYEAKPCPLCGELMSEDGIICRDCKDDLERDFNRLVDRYQSATADRETVLDIIAELFL